MAANNSRYKIDYMLNQFMKPSDIAMKRNYFSRQNSIEHRKPKFEKPQMLSYQSSATPIPVGKFMKPDASLNETTTEDFFIQGIGQVKPRGKYSQMLKNYPRNVRLVRISSGSS